MSDIRNVSDFLYNIFYADDTCFYLSSRDLCTLINLRNTESKLILHSLKANRFTLYTCKTFVIVFYRGKRKCLGNIGLYIDDIEIKETPTIKYLLVIIDSKLNWVSHITYVKNKVAKGIEILKKARPFFK